MPRTLTLSDREHQLVVAALAMLWRDAFTSGSRTLTHEADTLLTRVDSQQPDTDPTAGMVLGGMSYPWRRD